MADRPARRAGAACARPGAARHGRGRSRRRARRSPGGAAPVPARTSSTSPGSIGPARFDEAGRRAARRASRVDLRLPQPVADRQRTGRPISRQRRGDQADAVEPAWPDRGRAGGTARRPSASAAAASARAAHRRRRRIAREQVVARQERLALEIGRVGEARRRRSAACGRILRAAARGRPGASAGSSGDVEHQAALVRARPPPSSARRAARRSSARCRRASRPPAVRRRSSTRLAARSTAASTASCVNRATLSVQPGPPNRARQVGLVRGTRSASSSALAERNSAAKLPASCVTSPISPR